MSLPDTNNKWTETLRHALDTCSKFTQQQEEEGDYQKSIGDLVNLLNSISVSLVSALDTENDYNESEIISKEILTQIQHYLVSPSLNQEVIDALAFEIPKAVARFACISAKNLDVAERIVCHFVEKCNPRDMLSILCEALGSPSEHFMVPSYFVPLLTGIVKAFILIQRGHYKQIKAAVPVILNVLKVMAFKSDDEDIDCTGLFIKATEIASSMWGVCPKLEGKDNQKLRALLGLYVLQIMALVSHGMGSGRIPLMLELSKFLPHCELSYIGLITGCQVDEICNLVLDDDLLDCFSQVKLGAAVAVTWGYETNEVAVAAGSDFPAVIIELGGNWTRRREAIDTLKHLFVSPNLSWAMKKKAIEFLICIMEGIASPSNIGNLDYSMHMASLYSGLQGIQVAIMYAPDAALRKDAFNLFKKVLADNPPFLKFDVLKALITNSESPSMIGILLDLVREEMRSGLAERKSSSNDVLKHEVDQYISFWSPSVLELVEMILRPPMGGPPSLPEYSDAVLSALNLYRFVLITEATGNSNRTEILSREKLQKAYKEWLLPLHTLLSASVAENQKNNDDLTFDIACALNPVELVLFRCIELVEEKLKD